jgi:replication factor C subunit 2/4
MPPKQRNIPIEKNKDECDDEKSIINDKDDNTFESHSKKSEKKKSKKGKNDKKGRKKKNEELIETNKREIPEYFDESKPLDIKELFKGNDMIVVRKKSVNKNIRQNKNRNQTMWVDKYRPNTLEEIISHNDVKDMLTTSIKKGDLPHLLFHGGPGTGKTSTVLALVMQLYGPDRIHEKVLELNASDENGINVVRDKINKFAIIVVGSADPRYPSPAFKIVILDEADSMTSEAQTALKKVMEKTCDITRFVFICNYESKIIDAIKSRCAEFKFNPIPDELMIEKLKKIAENEDMVIDDGVFQIITDICEGDARRAINTLQNIKYVPRLNKKKITKEDIYEITSYIDKSFFDKYWNEIETTNVKGLRRIVEEITNTGYPMNYILQCIKDKVLESKLGQRQISDIIIQLGKVERMITCGADNWIQLLSVLAHINGLNRKIPIYKPLIY